VDSENISKSKAIPEESSISVTLRSFCFRAKAHVKGILKMLIPILVSLSARTIFGRFKVLHSPFLTQGPEVGTFESSLTRYTGARYCVAFSSGTAALHAAYFAAGIKPGNEVVVPALTFAATANAALYLGARPVFADILSDTGNIDVKDVERKLTKRTKAVVAVDYAGLPAELGAVRRTAKRHSLVFIEDAAQGLGASYKGKKVGVLADMTMFSFHPVKSITTGEGGAILTNNRSYYEKLIMFRTHGLTRDPRKLKNKTHASWHQEMQLLGYNYRLTDIQAALGTSQMKKLDRFIKARRAAASGPAFLRARAVLTFVRVAGGHLSAGRGRWTRVAE
jgi:dTDP-4-amino-4,6-dideoxygalactose transaminase